MSSPIRLQQSSNKYERDQEKKAPGIEIGFSNGRKITLIKGVDYTEEEFKNIIFPAIIEKLKSDK